MRVAGERAVVWSLRWAEGRKEGREAVGEGCDAMRIVGVWRSSIVTRRVVRPVVRLAEREMVVERFGGEVDLAHSVRQQQVGSMLPRSFNEYGWKI